MPAGLHQGLSLMKNSPFRASLLVASVAALLVRPVGAAESSNTAITNLNDLIATNRYQEAYTLGIQLMDELEGEPEFDFLFGLAAIETGRPNEAVFALERITYTYPDQQRVKLELGRALYLMNDLPGSREMFNEVLATNPADNIRANIQVFIDLIDERE
jgi:tetratricopeptide (TPR) repeat protein